MRRFLPIIAALIGVGALFVTISVQKSELEVGIGEFSKSKSCTKPPKFFKDDRVARSLIVDLTQQRFRGIGFLHNKDSIYRKQWGQYGYFGTFALSDSGDIYLAPMPFISIEDNTFDLQKNLYRLDSESGNLSVFMHFDTIHPSASNPFGIISVVFDCSDRSLWVSSIDETSYSAESGAIMHIEPKTRKVLKQHEGFDAFALALVDATEGRFLLASSAFTPALYAFYADDLLKQPLKLFELPNPDERIRKIKIIDKNTLKLQAIKFSYSLIAMSSSKYRTEYIARYDKRDRSWRVDIK